MRSELQLESARVLEFRQTQRPEQTCPFGADKRSKKRHRSAWPVAEHR